MRVPINGRPFGPGGYFFFLPDVDQRRVSSTTTPAIPAIVGRVSWSWESCGKSASAAAKVALGEAILSNTQSKNT